MNENDENDMYKFLVENKYIQTNINNNIYIFQLKPSSNISHTQYNNRDSTKFLNNFFPNFPFEGLKQQLKKETKETELNITKLGHHILSNDENNDEFNLNDLEIKKLIFIFCIVFFPFYAENRNIDRINFKYSKIPRSLVKRENKNYIQLYKEITYLRRKKYEFIDVYIDWVKCDKLKKFACYTYLHFLLNMVNDDIEFIEKEKENYDNYENIQNDLNIIRDEIKKIIDINNYKQIDSMHLKHLYSYIDNEFIKILKKKKLNVYGYKLKQWSDKNFLKSLLKQNNINNDEHNKIDIINYIVFYLRSLPTDIIGFNEHNTFSHKITYDELLTNLLTILIKKEFEIRYIDKAFTSANEYYNNPSKLWQTLMETVKNDIKTGLQNINGGKKSRKRKHNKLKKKRKSTRKKRRKSNKKHR